MLVFKLRDQEDEKLVQGWRPTTLKLDSSPREEENG